MKCSTDLVIDERFDSLTLTNWFARFPTLHYLYPVGLKGYSSDLAFHFCKVGGITKLKGKT